VSTKIASRPGFLKILALSGRIQAKEEGADGFPMVREEIPDN
jgi:hypothetical protein